MKIIDAHAHIGPFPNLEKSKELVLSSMEKHGVDYSLVSNCYAQEFADFKTKDQLTALKECVEFAREHPNKIGALFWIRPNTELLSEQNKDYVKANLDVIHGFKMHPYCSRLPFDDPKVVPYIEFALELDLPILVHTALDDESTIGHVVNVCKKYPKLVVVAAHLELFSNNAFAIERLAENPNLYGDTAWVNMKHAMFGLMDAGEDKILFGTDSPVDNSGDTLEDPIYLAYFLNAVRLPAKTYDKLMGINAAKIYKIKLD